MKDRKQVVEEENVAEAETRKKMKQIERQLRCLTFRNPGPLVADFNPETRLQTKRARRTKLRQLVFEKKADGQRKYDQAGKLLLCGTDLCDCLNANCSGCFYPCPKCSSWKCGPKCRCNRKWIYEQIETEGSDAVQMFPNFDSNGICSDLNDFIQ
ncbi:ARL14 effector protein-like [Callorhinchus milii]|nr:ARL14 effector protein-like [Callorhinchus milii]|eukprot:gi/632959333/ref/XP_007895562.1/ PREDICTED: ARL14 effector protein-like [Callorhinchus milii]